MATSRHLHLPVLPSPWCVFVQGVRCSSCVRYHVDRCRSCRFSHQWICGWSRIPRPSDEFVCRARVEFVWHGWCFPHRALPRPLSVVARRTIVPLPVDLLPRVAGTRLSLGIDLYTPSVIPPPSSLSFQPPR
ncbi:hypothetical protein BC629DRAFT_1489328 [Irpex lacteus]|nr:hypothetical protein BC629DRAFT_1489328 [Irpex lacteus]